MKICYLSNSAIPSTVASSIQIVKMCEAFSELKNDVLLITTNVKKKDLNIMTLRIGLVLKESKILLNFLLVLNIIYFLYFQLLKVLSLNLIFTLLEIFLLVFY